MTHSTHRTKNNLPERRVLNIVGSNCNIRQICRSGSATEVMAIFVPAQSTLDTSSHNLHTHTHNTENQDIAHTAMPANRARVIRIRRLLLRNERKSSSLSSRIFASDVCVCVCSYERNNNSTFFGVPDARTIDFVAITDDEDFAHTHSHMCLSNIYQ